MKYITKNKEPIEFTEWKGNDKMYKRGKPNWNRLTSSERDIIREALKKEQGEICCYCESELLVDDYHIEHLKPKAKNKYPELQLEYDNLLCSCQLEIQKGEPRHCGNSKGSWFDDKLLISPLNPSCESKFKYTYDGHIKPEINNDIKAKTTIERLELDIEKLVDMREKAIEPFLDDTLNADELKKFTEIYLTKQGDKFNPFYSTIKYLFE